MKENRIVRSAVTVVILLILAAGCSFREESNEKISSVLMNPSQEARTLHVSELMDVNRTVALETTDSVLLSEHAEIVLTEKFIVALPHEFFGRNESIYQFDSEGKFMRVLARSGQGPSEYTGIHVHTVDAKNEILYYMHIRDKEHIQRIDLNSGKFLEPIPLPLTRVTRSEKLAIANLDILPDGTLACTPRMQPEVDQLTYQIFYLTPKGEFRGGIRAHADRGFSNPYTNPTVVNDELHYFGSVPDTLFLVQDSLRSPLTIFNTATPFELSSGKGHVVYDLLETPSSWVGMAVHFPVQTANADIWKEASSGMFFIDKKNGRSAKISSLNIDFLNLEIEPKVFALYRSVNEMSMLQEVWFQRISSSGNLGAVKIDAASFKKEASRIISEGTASADVLKQVKQLDARLKEDSNPVLVIGKWK
jgi:hypothetical protein